MKLTVHNFVTLHIYSCATCKGILILLCIKLDALFFA